jgi:hypothetical protein
MKLPFDHESDPTRSIQQINRTIQETPGRLCYRSTTFRQDDTDPNSMTLEESRALPASLEIVQLLPDFRQLR